MNQNINMQLKPQDLLLALKLHILRNEPRPKLQDLGIALGMSQAEVSNCLRRSIYSGLSNPETGVPYPQALKDFIIHGLKYVFPAQPGPVVKGMPTSHAAAPLSKRILSKEAFVWPHIDGELRGQAIEPIYPSAPQAAKNDSKLYELLALIDAVRVGQARERKLAIQEIEKRFPV